MNKAMAMGLASAALVLGACGGDDPPKEEKGSTTSHLEAGCVSSLPGSPGSPEWRAALDQCLGRNTPAPQSPPQGGNVPAPGPDDGPDDGPGGFGGFDFGGGAPPADPGGGGQACQSGISCENGACTCTSGPNNGKSCDGSKADGDDSCSVLCNFCQ